MKLQTTLKTIRRYATKLADVHSYHDLQTLGADLTEIPRTETTDLQDAYIRSALVIKKHRILNDPVLIALVKRYTVYAFRLGAVRYRDQQPSYWVQPHYEAAGQMFMQASKAYGPVRAIHRRYVKTIEKLAKAEGWDQYPDAYHMAIEIKDPHIRAAVMAELNYRNSHYMAPDPLQE